VYSATPSNTTPIVSIRVQDFAARPQGTTDGIDAGTPASCESTASTGQPVTLWFMFLMGTTQVGTAQSWQTSVDLFGPAPPGIKNVGAGGGLLKLEWTQNTDPDVFGYRIFCENMGSAGGVVTTYEAGAPGPDGSGRTTCPDASTGTTVDAGDDAGEDAGDDASTGGAVADACTPGTGGSSPPPTGCGSVLTADKVLTPDEIAQYSCGKGAGLNSTSAIVTGLTNYQNYAVAVAAADIVENVGKLSTVNCKTPQPVNGFDEAYQSAGGTAGGASFCSLGHRSDAVRAKLWPAGVLAAAFSLWQLRRRSRQRPSW
jgi:hypothetical protein